jgi:hypothetical protein
MQGDAWLSDLHTLLHTACRGSADTTDGALHTQLWIDPSEELSAYTHKGAPVDVTFSVKELKVQLVRALSFVGILVLLLDNTDWLQLIVAACNIFANIVHMISWLLLL